MQCTYVRRISDLSEMKLSLMMRKIKILFPIVMLFMLLVKAGISVANTNETSAEQEFKKAMKLRGDGKLEQSIKMFQGILSNNPRLQRARLELAVAYFFSTKYGKALKHARKVLNHPRTPESVKVRIREFIAKVRAKHPRHKIEPFVSLGFMHDSNVTVGPDQSILSGFPTLTVQVKTADAASLIQFGVSHRFSSDIEFNIGKQSATFLWLSKASYYHTDYLEENDSDLGVLSLSTGPALVAGEHWRAAINFRSDSIRLGSESYANFLAVNPTWTFTSKDQRTEVTLDVYLQDRDYKAASDADRDSDYTAYGISYGRVLTNDKFSYQLGVRAFDEEASASYNSNDGVEYFLGLSWRYSKFDNSYMRFSHKVSTYGGIEPGFTVARDEKLNRVVLGYEHKFSSGRLQNWTANIHWTYTTTESNIAVFEYDRHQFAVTFGKRFN